MIVLSILTLLVLTAATLTYTTGLELRASGNYGEAVQARMAALTGLPTAASALESRRSLAVAYNQRWANAAEASSRQAAQAAAADRSSSPDSARDANSQGPRLDWTHASQAFVNIEDEGGKLALNTLAADARTRADSTQEELPTPASRFDEQDLRDLIQRVAANRDLQGVAPDQLAAAVHARLFGADGQLGGVGGVLNLPRQQRLSQSPRADLLPGDPRYPPSGDDLPFVSLDQLLTLPGMPQDSDAARQALKALSAALTVFSQTRLCYEADGELYDCLDPNTASAEDMLAALQRVYPELDETALKQWIVNVIDWRDADSTPAQFPGAQSLTPILGVERTPYLNEVWPDSTTSAADGDDGQYFELYNPYDEAISLQGWSVRIGGAGHTVILQGQIEAHGFVVVTDDLNGTSKAGRDAVDPIYGCFLNYFGTVGDGVDRRIQEDPDMDLPNGGATLFLHNERGDLVDYFPYGADASAGGAKLSAQRADPRARSYERLRCTPLARNANDQTSAEDFAANPLRDKPFATPAGLFNVFVDAAPPSGQTSDQTADQTAEGALLYPRLRDSQSGLDARLLDVFAVTDALDQSLKQVESESMLEDQSASAPASRPAASRPAALSDEPGPRPIQSEKMEETPVRLASGRINLNTAPLSVLLSLPGMPEEAARRALQW
ncbi:MAG: hypothetical protein NTW86_24540, partial [Candidatus Sumerlaeota bacterium]|nr:hypothetical protein [Candidatus Sumerlaeota bacterium]